MSQVHSRALTTPLIRAGIRTYELSVVELAERYNINRGTAAKWKNREDAQDRSHRPHKLITTLSEGQEALVAEVRRLTLIPLGDLLVVVREFINLAVSRSGLDRWLRRHGVGVGSLRELKAQAREAAGEAALPDKTFKDYEPGFVHIDLKYLPQMPDEAARLYLFVAIDRATRWVFLRVCAVQSEASSVDFLERLHEAAPMKITKVLTDNGRQFTDRFTSKAREPSGKHNPQHVRRPRAQRPVGANSEIAAQHRPCAQAGGRRPGLPGRGHRQPGRANHPPRQVQVAQRP